MVSGEAGSQAATVVGRGWGEFTLVWLGFPLAAGVLGWFAKPLVQWALGLSWVPFQGPLELIESIPDPVSRYVLLAAGLIIGVVVALTAEGELVRVAVSDERVQIRIDDDVSEFGRPAVGAVFVEDKHLVLQGIASDELTRQHTDRDVDQLRDAFVEHGYPWHDDGDPHRGDFHRWVEDTPELSGAVNAVLKARERALDKGDKADSADLRKELSKLGIVVRDEGKRQYWRRVSGWSHD